MGMRSDRIVLVVSLLLLIGALSLWWQGAFASSKDDLVLLSGADTPKGEEQSGKAQGTSEEGGAYGKDGSGVTSPEDAVQTGKNQIFVHVTGAVKSPGVYRLVEGQRVYEVLELAEPLHDADVDVLNLAGVLYDQEKIYVPKKGEFLPGPDSGASREASSPAAGGGASTPNKSVFPININTAGAKELQNLPGIGPAKAQAIVDYRTKQGPFARKEDIKKVSGIGEATYSKIEPLITAK